MIPKLLTSGLTDVFRKDIQSKFVRALAPKKQGFLSKVKGLFSSSARETEVQSGIESLYKELDIKRITSPHEYARKKTIGFLREKKALGELPNLKLSEIKDMFYKRNLAVAQKETGAIADFAGGFTYIPKNMSGNKRFKQLSEVHEMLEIAHSRRTGITTPQFSSHVGKEVIEDEALIMGATGKKYFKEAKELRRLYDPKSFEIYKQFSPDKNDKLIYEALRHGGMAETTRKVHSDFGSGWLGNAISKASKFFYSNNRSSLGLFQKAKANILSFVTEDPREMMSLGVRYPGTRASRLGSLAMADVAYNRSTELAQLRQRLGHKLTEAEEIILERAKFSDSQLFRNKELNIAKQQIQIQKAISFRMKGDMPTAMGRNIQDISIKENWQSKWGSAENFADEVMSRQRGNYPSVDIDVSQFSSTALAKKTVQAPQGSLLSNKDLRRTADRKARWEQIKRSTVGHGHKIAHNASRRHRGFATTRA